MSSLHLPSAAASGQFQVFTPTEVLIQALKKPQGRGWSGVCVGCTYEPHFTAKETEAQWGAVTCQGSQPVSR